MPNTSDASPPPHSFQSLLQKPPFQPISMRFSIFLGLVALAAAVPLANQAVEAEVNTDASPEVQEQGPRGGGGRGGPPHGGPPGGGPGPRPGFGGPGPGGPPRGGPGPGVGGALGALEGAVLGGIAQSVGTQIGNNIADAAAALNPLNLLRPTPTVTVIVNGPGPTYGYNNAPAQPWNNNGGNYGNNGAWGNNGWRGKAAEAEATPA
ncbi:hypothetical protein EJ06DRAFT_547706 [Trichodelitschia bisporula]|uniref:Uncharacterized protein n=1 Tax=Trichodelitschia bisporula TaxID=703511 RepID=A0A6G1I232_9PEZI|nr:hypothetical protein EJ06DRAFT_547706 [Trichodelitschia bisporula]